MYIIHLIIKHIVSVVNFIDVYIIKKQMYASEKGNSKNEIRIDVFEYTMIIIMVKLL